MTDGAPPQAGTAFEEDTALQQVAPGLFAGRVDRRWWIQRGPNGGYVAAIVIRALAMAVDDPARAPRSVTVHYTAPPEEGPVEIETTVERTGRSQTSGSARMRQDGRLIALALGAFSAPRDGPEFHDAAMPAVPPPEELEPLPRHPSAPPFVEQFDLRRTLGDQVFSGSDSAVVGGWTRLVEPRLLDAPQAAAYLDAWFPAVWPRLTEPVLAPTVDLTFHFRAQLPPRGAAVDDFYLGVFRSSVAADGFFEEDGELWSRGGVLLAQSRQLALALPAPRRPPG